MNNVRGGGAGQRRGRSRSNARRGGGAAGRGNARGKRKH